MAHYIAIGQDIYLLIHPQFIPIQLYSLYLLTLFWLRIYCLSLPNDKQKSQITAAIAIPQ